MIKIMTPVVHFGPHFHPFSHQWVKRYIDKDCLNIVSIYVRQKIKFNDT